MKSLDRLLSCFRRMPGIGPKQAERLAMYVLRAPQSDIQDLAETLMETKSAIRLCSQCCDYSEDPICPICADESRDRTLICVVEDAQDVAAVEKSRTYRGIYHVLHGALSSLRGVGPRDIRIRELLERLSHGVVAVSEVIVATDPDADGETTALYLASQIKPMGIAVTRIACGVPLGGDLDYIDEWTLSHSLAGRRPLEN
ncbi:MAG: recombination protein RecR [Elusimicrobia bacterium]|nr:recombination protein RecR [Elusimicrobiota bacterium]